MDPFGFMFFACNRGLIDTATNMPAYHSFLSKNNELSDIGEYNLGFHSPYLPDTQQDVTYMIFDEEPDPELCGILYPMAFEPLQATNFEFIGVYGDNNTLVNCGGYFKFDIANATSVTVTIDLSHVKFTVDGAEEYRDLGIVRLNNTVTAGTNYLYWDGCDGNGNPLPAGTYDLSLIHILINRLVRQAGLLFCGMSSVGKSAEGMATGAGKSHSAAVFCAVRSRIHLLLCRVCFCRL